MIHLYLIFQHSQNPSVLLRMQSDLVGGFQDLHPDLDLPLRGELLHVDHQAEVVVDWHHIVW